MDESYTVFFSVAVLWLSCNDRPAAPWCVVPEVLDVVLHSTEVQSVGQRLVVGQSLGGRAPVHIWMGGRMQAETHTVQLGSVFTGRPAGAKGQLTHVVLQAVRSPQYVCVAACQTECAHRCV